MGQPNEFEHICQRRKRKGNPPREWPILSKLFGCFADTAEPDIEVYHPRTCAHSNDKVLVNVAKIVESPIHYNTEHIPKFKPYFR